MKSSVAWKVYLYEEVQLAIIRQIGLARFVSAVMTCAYVLVEDLISVVFAGNLSRPALSCESSK